MSKENFLEGGVFARPREHHLSHSSAARFVSYDSIMSIQAEQPAGKEIKNVCDVIGDWGKWQINIVTFCITSAAFSAFNNLVSAFYAPEVTFFCSDTQKAGNVSYDQCYIGEEKCSSWSYNSSVFDNTAVQKFNLVCDRSFYASLSQSMYMLGIVFSALIFGHCSDKYGRKPSLWVAVAIEIAAGISSAFSTNVYVFMAARFFLGFGCYGRNLTGFLLGVESVGVKYRAAVGFAYQFGWAFGYCLLPYLAYQINDYQKLILTTTTPEILWLIWLIWIPESPRWQLTHNKMAKAEVTARKAATLNGVNLEVFNHDFQLLKQNVEKQNRPTDETNQGFIDLWRTKLLRMYTLVFYVTWFTNAFVYYGISLNIENLNSGSLFWNFFWTGFIEFPSYIFCIFAIKYVGRRTLLCIMMLGSGISCLAFIFLSHQNTVLVLLVTLAGKFCITSSFGIIYVYSAEVYPTVLRQIGVGSCSVAGRVGSIVAPFIKELTQITSFGFSMGIFGVLSLITAVVAMKLPETRGKEIPDKVEDVEKLCK